MAEEQSSTYPCTVEIPGGKKVRLFQEVYAVGAGLGHVPFPTMGLLTSLDDEIDRKIYWMSSANIIFGSSGGGVYLDETREFIGVPSRVAVTFAGFSAVVATHMGYFVPPQRVYEFLEAQGFAYLYDPQAPSREDWLKLQELKAGGDR